MVANKSSTNKKANWGSLGGNNKMHGFQPTGTQTPDRTSQEGHGGGRRGIAPQAGPSDVMGYSDGSKQGREMTAKHGTNQSFAGTQTPGQSVSQPNGDKNGFAKGGNTAMFGNRGSRPAQGGKSSPE